MSFPPHLSSTTWNGKCGRLETHTCDCGVGRTDRELLQGSPTVSLCRRGPERKAARPNPSPHRLGHVPPTGSPSVTTDHLPPPEPPATAVTALPLSNRITRAEGADPTASLSQGRGRHRPRCSPSPQRHGACERLGSDLKGSGWPEVTDQSPSTCLSRTRGHDLRPRRTTLTGPARLVRATGLSWRHRGVGRTCCGPLCTSVGVRRAHTHTRTTCPSLFCH